MRRKALSLGRIVAAAVLFLPFCGVGRNEPTKLPNVLLISLDTLRADHLGCYGYGRDTSPNLDKFAKEGVLFESVTAAASWTVPSHMSLFTSLYPSVHGVESVDKQLGEAIPTMAEILARNGYATAGFVTGPSLNRAMGFHRGFQSYDDYTVNLMCEENLFHDLDAKKLTVNQVPTNHVITNLATAWLKKHADERFFLFVHYWDCHSDYIPPPPYDKRFDPDYAGPEDGRNIAARHAELEGNAPPEVKRHLVALYDGEIGWTDSHVGKLLATLSDLRLSEKTIVIILSDHGEGFWEHGKIEHGYGLYEELVHVALLMRWPGMLPAGARVKGDVSHVDLLPTLLGLLGLPKPQITHGLDLSSVCLGKQEVPDRPVFSESKGERAVRWGPYKVIQEPSKPVGPLLVVRNGGENEAQKVGVNERTALDARQRLVATLNAGVAHPAVAGWLAKPAEPDEKTTRLLRSLGYMQ
jgi:arylsulfatase A-like enzyme